jgi:hypothetical protein
MTSKFILIAIVLWANLSFATTVTFYDGASQSLDQKWAWAVKSAAQDEDKIWIGYSIERTDKNCRIGSWSDSKTHKTLYDLLGQSKPDNSLNSKVALLFLVDHSKGHSTINDVKIGSFDSEFNFENHPLYWLEAVEQDESVTWLKKQYTTTDGKIKKDFVAAFGLHENEASTKILINMVKSESVKIQKDAVFWLSQSGHEDAFDFLVETLDAHPEMAVRKAAVFSISQIKTDQAVDAIIKTARTNSTEKIRKEAIFWLGQLAADKSTKALHDIIYDEPTLELKKHAVFSLSQIENDKAVDDLIKIAKTHPNGEVRKSAIFWLGETGSDKALDVLVGLLKD